MLPSCPVFSAFPCCHNVLLDHPHTSFCPRIQRVPVWMYIYCLQGDVGRWKMRYPLKNEQQDPISTENILGSEYASFYHVMPSTLPSSIPVLPQHYALLPSQVGQLVSHIVPQILGMRLDVRHSDFSLGGSLTSPDLVQNNVEIGRHESVSVHHGVCRQAVCAHLVVLARVSVCNHSVCFANGDQLCHGACPSGAGSCQVVSAPLSEEHPVPAEMSAVAYGGRPVTKYSQVLRHWFIFSVHTENIASIGRGVLLQMLQRKTFMVISGSKVKLDLKKKNWKKWKNLEKTWKNLEKLEKTGKTGKNWKNWKKLEKTGKKLEQY
ncbi:hypothetical protein B0I72DRAFT_163121 [Yarrowia lipolytica]|nr:hypothetical protein B0I72DRAFT_163121 [Yarrowia lipolytica]